MSKQVDLIKYTSKILDRAHILYAMNDSLIVGIMAYYFNKSPRNSFLTLLVVDESCRGQGIGKILLEKMLDFCKINYSAGVDLEVTCINERAVSLYKKKGFHICDEYWDAAICQNRYHMSLLF